MTSASPEAAALMIRLGNALGTATRPSVLRAELTKSVASIRALFGAAACSCALVQPGGADLRFVAADGKGAAAIIDVRLPVGRGIAGWVVMSGQPITVSDVNRDARFARDVAESTDYVPRSIMAAPLIDEAGEITGVIEVLDPAGTGGHSGRELDVLSLLATQTAAVVRLSEVFDGLGDALTRSLLGASNSSEFGQALREIASSSDEATNLSHLAAAFHDLAETGPDGLHFAATVLAEAAAFARRRR